MARRGRLAVLVIAALLSGCADRREGPARGGEEAIRTAARLATLPQGVVARCAALAPRRAVRVLCPTRLPAARWYVRYQSLRSARSEYLTNLDTRPAGAGDPFHVLAGGRRGRFSLRSITGRWPADAGLPRDLGLVGAQSLKPGDGREQRPVGLTLLRRAQVGRRPALLLRVADYPDGGVHGGHLAVVWNQGRDGYVLSLHFAEHSRRTPAEREAVLLAAATAMSRSGTPLRGPVYSGS